MISREQVIKLIEDLRSYEPGMRRAQMHLIADDYWTAASIIEELQALCDEKDATINEMAYKIGSLLMDSCANTASEIGPFTAAACVNEGVVRGPITDPEIKATELWNSTREGKKKLLESFARSRGVL